MKCISGNLILKTPGDADIMISERRAFDPAGELGLPACLVCRAACPQLHQKRRECK